MSQLFSSIIVLQTIWTHARVAIFPVANLLEWVAQSTCCATPSAVASQIPSSAQSFQTQADTSAVAQVGVPDTFVQSAVTLCPVLYFTESCAAQSAVPVASTSVAGSAPETAHCLRTQPVTTASVAQLPVDSHRSVAVPEV